MAVDPFAFAVFGFQIRWYGIIFSLSIIIGFIVFYFFTRYRKQKTDEATNFFPFALIFGLIGARLLHVAVNWSYYFGYFPFLKTLISILDFRRGGLAVQGAMLGGVLALLVFCKVRKLNFWLWADIAVPGLLLGQAIGRWGDFFNQKAFGKPTSLPWGIFIEQANRPMDYASYEYFHPTFLYGSIAGLILFILLVFMHRFYKNKPGILPYGLILPVYLGVYAVYRTFIEYYRLDSSYLGPIKIVYIINFLTLAAALIIAIYVIKKFREKKLENIKKTIY